MGLLTDEKRIVTIGQNLRSATTYFTYAYLTGTSMAAPHAAAAAALVWSHFPHCTNHQIRHALSVTAQDMGLPGCDYDYGHVIVKARDAYE
jgi:serine protease